jgi:hypothetical protein
MVHLMLLKRILCVHQLVCVLASSLQGVEAMEGLLRLEVRFAVVRLTSRRGCCGHAVPYVYAAYTLARCASL